MTIAEKNERVRINLCEFKINADLQFLFHKDLKFDLDSFLNRLTTLRNKDSFKLTGFDKKLLCEELFTFKYIDRRVRRYSPLWLDWDQDGNIIENDVGKCKSSVNAINVPVMFHLSIFNSKYYLHSFLKMVNDYFAYSLKGWDDSLVVISLRCKAPHDEENESFPLFYNFYFQENHEKKFETPIVFNLSKVNPVTIWLTKQLSENKFKEYGSTDYLFKITMEDLKRLKKHLKINNNDQLKEFFYDDEKFSGLHGTYSFAVNKHQDYSFNDPKGSI